MILTDLWQGSRRNVFCENLLSGFLKKTVTYFKKTAQYLSQQLHEGRPKILHPHQKKSTTKLTMEPIHKCFHREKWSKNENLKRISLFFAKIKIEIDYEDLTQVHWCLHRIQSFACVRGRFLSWHLGHLLFHWSFSFESFHSLLSNIWRIYDGADNKISYWEATTMSNFWHMCWI